MLERGLGGRVVLGLIPSGTGSDLARTLEVPRDAKAALALALSDHCHLIDVLRLEADDGRRRYAVNVASAGISGLVDEAMHALPRRSALSYLTTTLGALARYRNVPCRVTVDGAVWREGDVLLVAVANGHTFGNGMRVAPHALCDDGEADVVLVNPVPRALLPFRLPQIYLGTHLSARFVRWGRARRVRIEPLAPMPPFDLDGEPFPSAASSITLEERALLVARGVRKPARAPSRRDEMRATPGKGSDASC
jgi:diacylglycerol kinase (ATP)